MIEVIINNRLSVDFKEQHIDLRGLDGEAILEDNALEISVKLY